jgi:hypothetical protein
MLYLHKNRFKRQLTAAVADKGFRCIAPRRILD